MISASFITADIVNSTLLTDSEMAVLREELEKLLNSYGCMYEFFRYDSFQVLHREPINSLKLIMLLRSQVRKFNERGIDIRTSLTLGEVKAPIQSLAFSNDEVFIMSGRHFDEMSDTGSRLSITLAGQTTNICQPGFTAIALFTDYLLCRTTSKQAQVLNELVQGLSQADITRKLGKTPSTIHKHVKAIGWNEIEQLLNIFQTMIMNCK
ncbi:MAG TPA: hypothetical protein PKN44_14075 [Bacteroidales bacterium]|nr:hypothetical protein [Bacteroidales bacterium]